MRCIGQHCNGILQMLQLPLDSLQLAAACETGGNTMQERGWLDQHAMRSAAHGSQAPLRQSLAVQAKSDDVLAILTGYCSLAAALWVSTNPRHTSQALHRQGTHPEGPGCCAAPGAQA